MKTLKAVAVWPHLFAAGVCVMAISASAERAVANDFDALNEAAVADYLLPRYAAFAAAGESLDDALRQDCADSQLDATESGEAFHDMMDAWMAVQHLRFGPSELFLRADRIQFWPDRRGVIGRHLAKLLSARDPAALESDRFAKGSVAVQGLSALERLLFALPEDADPAFVCALTETIGANLREISAGMLQGWRDGPSAYAETLRGAREGNANYLDAKEASLQLAKSLRAALLLAVDFKLGRPLGETEKAAKPKRAESWRSDRSLRNIRVNLQAAEELYVGTDNAGFSALLRGQAGGDSLDKEIADAFRRSEDKLAALPPSLREALDAPDGWKKVDALRKDLSRLLALISGPFSQALDLPLGFNSYDGD